MTNFDANNMLAAAQNKTREDLAEILEEIEVLAGSAIETIGDIVTDIDKNEKQNDRQKLAQANRAKEKLTRVIANLEAGSNPRREEPRPTPVQPEPTPEVKLEPKVADAPKPEPTPEVKPSLVKRAWKNFQDNRSASNTPPEAPASS